MVRTPYLIFVLPSFAQMCFASKYVKMPAAGFIISILQNVQEQKKDQSTEIKHSPTCLGRVLRLLEFNNKESNKQQRICQSVLDYRAVIAS